MDRDVIMPVDPTAVAGDAGETAEATDEQIAAKFEEVMGSMLMLDLVFEHLADNE